MVCYSINIGSRIIQRETSMVPVGSCYESAEAMAEINDEADLLDFVHDLDFDQYDQDLELQALMGQVKERIKRLQREKKKDETTLRTCVDVSTSCLECSCLIMLIFLHYVFPLVF